MAEFGINGLNGLDHHVPLVLSFPTIPNSAMEQDFFADVITVIAMWVYSNYAYQLQEAIVKSITGKTFEHSMTASTLPTEPFVTTVYQRAMRTGKKCALLRCVKNCCPPNS
ncbi:hypothetical protein TYRP_000012 [Tyrophagus putrescentiae]|nr:hypothetical protein TYRP_000012 [Tyrophagus putrescentiae]